MHTQHLGSRGAYQTHE